VVRIDDLVSELELDELDLTRDLDLLGQLYLFG